MNHPKGEESTSVGEPCSSRTTCPQRSVLRQSQPRQLRYCGRGGHLRSEAYAAGLAPFFVAEPAVPPRGLRQRGRAEPGLAWLSVRLRWCWWAERSPACFARRLGQE